MNSTALLICAGCALALSPLLGYLGCLNESAIGAFLGAILPLGGAGWLLIRAERQVQVESKARQVIRRG